MIPSLAKLSLQCQEVGADYDPAEGGNDDLQLYFTDMLLDSDRNAKYFAAIKSCRRCVERRRIVHCDGRRNLADTPVSGSYVDTVAACSSPAAVVAVVAAFARAARATPSPRGEDEEAPGIVAQRSSFHLVSPKVCYRPWTAVR